ncbi:MAG TPA: FHA domain-containing protein, partial [Ilumatobacteraceae bacterium]
MQNDPDDNDDDGSGRPFTATVVAGPAVTAGVDLGVGRSVIGRAVTCAVVVPDAAVEAHHVALDLTADGSASIRQLTGRRPVLVDGDPVDGTTIAHAGVLLTMGNSLVRLDRRPPARAAMAVGVVPDDSGRRLVLRPPRAPRIAPDATVSVPAPAASPPTPPGATAIVGGLVAAVAALGLAAVVGQPMFAVFGAMGAVVSIATWGVQRVGWARTAKRARAATVASERELESAIEAAGRRLRTHHVESVMTAADALGLVGTDAQWMRRTEHGDAFEVSLGIGEVERSIDIVAAGSSSLADTNHAAARELARRYGRLNAVAYDVRLDAHDPEVVAITGEHAMALANALVAQLAVHTGPADWCLVAAVDHPEAHGWVHRLPHAGIAGLPGLVGSDDRAALVDLLDQAALTDRRLVLLTDRPDLLAERSSVLRTF